jgi:hypothetical protein
MKRLLWSKSKFWNNKAEDFHVHVHTYTLWQKRRDIIVSKCTVVARLFGTSDNVKWRENDRTIFYTESCSTTAHTIWIPAVRSSQLLGSIMTYYYASSTHYIRKTGQERHLPTVKTKYFTNNCTILWQGNLGATLTKGFHWQGGEHTMAS